MDFMLHRSKSTSVWFTVTLYQAIPMQYRYVHHGRNLRGTDYAVGDIHGCFSALQRALDAIGFDPACDRLFALGDLVNRGPESGQVLDWLDKPWFHALCGNHDFMVWRDAEEDPYPHVDHRQHGGEWLGLLPANQRRLIGQRLRTLPVAAEVDTAAGPVGLLHAECPFDDWQHMREGALSQQDLHICLWARTRFRTHDATLIQNIRAVAHGHMTIAQARKLGNRFYLDTGGWMPGHGHFTFLNLARLEWIVRDGAPALA